MEATVVVQSTLLPVDNEEQNSVISSILRINMKQGHCSFRPIDGVFRACIGDRLIHPDLRTSVSCIAL